MRIDDERSAREYAYEWIREASPARARVAIAGGVDAMDRIHAINRGRGFRVDPAVASARRALVCALLWLDLREIP